jgi:hypothetical protein
MPRPPRSKRPVLSSEEEPYQPPAPFSWEDRAVFRETLLFYFTQPGAAAVLRQVGTLLYDMTLGACGEWPEWPESQTRAELRAAVADLFQMQGFLSEIWKDGELSAVPAEDAPLCHRALDWSRVAARLAREIDGALGPIPGEVAS